MIDNVKIAALCIAKIQDSDSCRKLISSLSEELNRIGYRLFIYSTDGDMFWNTPNELGEKTVFDLIDFSVIDAIIIYDEIIKNATLTKELISKAAQKKVPAFIVEGDYEDCINVNFDYVGGFEKVVKHILDDHGLKRIHFMAGIKGNEYSETRFRVISKLMEERGLPFGKKDVSYGDFWDVPARKATNALLKRGEPLPEAIICANDAMALSVCSELSEHDIDVPGQVVVTGFDGIEEIYFSKPMVSSCICSYKDMAEKICELMLDERDYSEKTGTYYVLPELARSESCGCKPDIEVNVPEYITNLNIRFSRFQEEERVMNKIASKIQDSSSIYEAARELKSGHIYDMCILLKNECLDPSINPTTIVTNDSFGEGFKLIWSCLDGDHFVPVDFSRKNIVPHLDYLLKCNMPLVFTAIHSMQIPLGYACFFYHKHEDFNYYKVFQITSMLNGAFGGYRNMHYQRYLQKKIEDSYKLDNLTGFYNRNGFFRAYDELLSELKREGGTLVVALADLDNLKYINDTYGHAVGDKAICAVANSLRLACHDAIFCRFGGDEMLAVKKKTEDSSAIRKSLDTLLDNFNETCSVPFSFSASLGIYETDDLSQMNFETLLVKADELMYEEKRKKKIKRGVYTEA